MLIVKYDQRQWIATFVKSIYSGKQTNKQRLPDTL